jgi:hypothetical protein
MKDLIGLAWHFAHDDFHMWEDGFGLWAGVHAAL